MKKALIVTDNEYLLGEFIKLSESAKPDDWTFEYACSTNDLEKKLPHVRKMVIKEDINKIIDNYELVISLHCKQLFPDALIKNVRCVNVHPGLNPHNRGWFPQVFSILNKLPVGATIHEIDEEIDHGNIIAQKEVSINSWDTSKNVYDRVLLAELDLLRAHLTSILNNTYTASKPTSEGNLNLKKDFNALRQVNLDEKATYGEVIDRMRALTHEPYSNMFYIDRQTGKKVHIKIQFQVED